MQTKVPLSHVVRPRGSRDEAGQQGELYHQLADWLEAEVDAAMTDAVPVPEQPTVGQVLELLEVVKTATAARFPERRFAPVFASLEARDPAAFYEPPRR